MKKPPQHPIQPLVDEHGITRFKRNEIVRYLLDKGPFDMNALAALPFSDEDREQFAQLVGYSLSGFAELSYVSDATYERASKVRVFRGERESGAMILPLSREKLNELQKDCVLNNEGKYYGRPLEEVIPEIMQRCFDIMGTVIDEVEQALEREALSHNEQIDLDLAREYESTHEE